MGMLTLDRFRTGAVVIGAVALLSSVKTCENLLENMEDTVYAAVNFFLTQYLDVTLGCRARDVNFRPSSFLAALIFCSTRFAFYAGRVCSWTLLVPFQRETFGLWSVSPQDTDSQSEQQALTIVLSPAFAGLLCWALLSHFPMVCFQLSIQTVYAHVVFSAWHCYRSIYLPFCLSGHAFYQNDLLSTAIFLHLVSLCQSFRGVFLDTSLSAKTRSCST